MLKINFHLLDHIVEEINRFSNVKYIDTRAFENFNVEMKKYYRKNYIRYTILLEEKVTNISHVLK